MSTRQKGYFDGLYGLVPCEVISFHTNLYLTPPGIRLDRPSPTLVLRVTRDTRCYQKGHVIETSPGRFVEPAGTPLAMMCRSKALRFL